MTPTVSDQELRFWHSPEIDKIAGALAKAQSVIENASKDAVNPHFKSKYADLAAVMEACRKPLSANEIAIVQCPSANETEMSMVTMLVHASGQFFASRLSMVPRDNSPQSAGSAITYARRYSLMAMAGIAPDDEDDDGNAANGRQQPYQRQQESRPTTPRPTPPAQQAAAPSRPVPEELRTVFSEMVDDKRHFQVARESYRDRLEVAGGASEYIRLTATFDKIKNRVAKDAQSYLMDLHDALGVAEAKAVPA